MTFLFEDNSNQPLSGWLRDGLVGHTVEFSEGSGGLREKIAKLYDPHTDMVVYIDTAFDNNQLRHDYRILMEFLVENNYTRVYVIPIPCIEYCFIKAFYETDALSGEVLFEDTKLIDVCVKMGAYKQFCQKYRPKMQSYCRTFEKFCKGILIQKTKVCAAMIGHNPRRFYDNSCSRELCVNCKVSKTREEKIRILLSCIPVISVVIKGELPTQERLMAYHEAAVAQYNDLIKTHAGYGDINLAGSPGEMRNFEDTRKALQAQEAERQRQQELHRVEGSTLTYTEEEDKSKSDADGRTDAFSDM